ncbi:Dna mismatch repair protein msh3 [Thalictrum thalictroides]|uniref:DNA mismatch repair protein n=1 Tax=Thalictrum thalictroides TaxID=46969 RepID=A0A7J6W3T8_THATH|nr:Dna mismatch repair protein msh3 [Thalictrum thalictroides]
MVKQQVISRFFAPKPKSPSSSSTPNPQNPNPNPDPIPLTPPPKISATASLSSSKRLRSSQLSSPAKKPKLSPHTHNPIPSLHEKFVQKLLEPSTTAPNINSSLSSNPKYTPLEQQVLELKAKYPDVLLMIEVGYKYRFFGEDAEIAARVLGIYAHIDHNFMTASIPTFRLNVHVRRLVSVGYKVGVVKQTETAAIKSHGSNRLAPFSRGLSALYTKATLEAAEEMAGGGEEGCGSSSNYLICVVEKGVVGDRECGVESGFDVRIGFVAVEISTGDVVFGEFNDNVTRMALEGVVLSLSPAEVLLGEPLSKQTERFLLSYAGPTSSVRVERASRNCFKDGGALAEVMVLCENMGGDSSTNVPEHIRENRTQGTHCLGVEGIMEMPGLTVQALALIMRHLKQFGFQRILCLGASLRPFSSNIEMTLSANALQQLEVLRNNSDGSETGSLLHTMNHTLTIFGSRLLKHWVTHPLCDRNSISARLDAVSEIAESMDKQNLFVVGSEDGCAAVLKPVVSDVLSSALTTLGRSPDIQRGITRIFHRTATASEFIAVIHAMLHAGKQLQQLLLRGEDDNGDPQEMTVHSALLRRLLLTASSPTVVSHAAKLLSNLNKDAADQKDIQNLFIVSDGQFPEVARSQTTVQVANHKLDSLIDLYRKQLGVRNLDFISVSGSTHLIELPLNVKVPSNWIKVNSTKKTIRYHPPEVMKALDELLLAKEELTLSCRSAWNSFLDGFSKYYAEFQASVQALAALDCLHSLAIISRNKNYVHPIFVEDSESVQIHIHSGRHPVLDMILQDSFVPNDTNLQADGEYCQIVTGPNMGGKSCYIRQVALLAIMAQVGSFVPASLAKLHVLNGIYTRMGASDSIQQGRSTFLDELSEASHILHNSTSHSLVIIDELGRGTSTHDGVAIAYATLHHLLKKRCMILFVTHYPKIVDIKNTFPSSVGSYHVSYLTSENTQEMAHPKLNQSKNMEYGDITFLYKVVPGTSDKSFGLNVARLAQLPPMCIARAAVMAAKLEDLVAYRVATQVGKPILLKTESTCEDNFLDNLLETSGHVREQSGNYSLIDGIGAMGQLTAACHEVFLNLKDALVNSDNVRSFQSLKHASNVAVELMKRLTVSGNPNERVQDG